MSTDNGHLQLLLIIHSMYSNILQRWLQHKPKEIEIIQRDEIKVDSYEYVEQVDKMKQNIINFPLNLLTSGYTRKLVLEAYNDDQKFNKTEPNIIHLISNSIFNEGRIPYSYFKCKGYRLHVQPGYKNHPYQDIMTPVTSDEEESQQDNV